MILKGKHCYVVQLYEFSSQVFLLHISDIGKMPQLSMSLFILRIKHVCLFRSFSDSKCGGMDFYIISVTSFTGSYMKICKYIFSNGVYPVYR